MSRGRLEMRGCRLEAGGCRLETGGCRLEVGGCRLEAGEYVMETGGCRLAVGGHVLEVGGRRLAAGGCRMEAEEHATAKGGCRLETGGCRLKVGGMHIDWRWEGVENRSTLCTHNAGRHESVVSWLECDNFRPLHLRCGIFLVVLVRSRDSFHIFPLHLAVPLGLLCQTRTLLFFLLSSAHLPYIYITLSSPAS